MHRSCDRADDYAHGCAGQRAEAGKPVGSLVACPGDGDADLARCRLHQILGCRTRASSADSHVQVCRCVERGRACRPGDRAA